MIRLAFCLTLGRIGRRRVGTGTSCHPTRTWKTTIHRLDVWYQILLAGDCLHLFLCASEFWEILMSPLDFLGPRPIVRFE